MNVLAQPHVDETLPRRAMLRAAGATLAAALACALAAAVALAAPYLPLDGWVLAPRVAVPL